MSSAKEDPSVKMLRSGFGKQPTSLHESLPSWGFGTSHRDSYMKMYMSQEQTKALHGDNSQGPVYKTYDSVGSQVESKYQSASAPGFGTAARSNKSDRKGVPGPGAYQAEGGLGRMTESKRATSPRAVFGQSTRDKQSKVWLDDELMKTYCGRESPGPNTYQTPGSVGKQVDSKHDSAPAWRQGTSDRFKGGDSRVETPGAGTYRTFDAIGKQTLSQKKSLPAFKIGTGQRDASKKIFISKEHEKGAFGENSPGPVTSQFVSAMGAQKLSIKKSAPSWGFGSAKRMPVSSSSDSLGPGAYYA